MKVWLDANRLSLNVEKTNYIIFTHANIPPIVDCVRIQGTPICNVKCVKFLGIHLDDRLNYNDHVISLSKRLAGVVGVMTKLRDLVPVSNLRLIYNSLFQSVLSYGITVWGGCGKTNRTKIMNVQRRALKLLDKLPANLRHPLSFDSLYQYIILVQFHKILMGNELDNHFQNRIHTLLPNHSYNTRFVENENILLPAIRKSVAQKQFLFNAIGEWNKLTIDLKNIPSRNIFKSKLKLRIK